MGFYMDRDTCGVSGSHLGDVCGIQGVAVNPRMSIFIVFSARD